MTGALSSFETREILRRRYCPPVLRILFVGEAPPASGRFFYCADSGLYRAVRDVFVDTLPALRGSDFLTEFRRLGCYLVDLCGKPVDGLLRAERSRACVRSEARFAAALKQLQPPIVVTLVRSIAPNVRRALVRANCSCSVVEVPYPARWKKHREEFARLLAPALREEFGMRENVKASGGEAVARL
jgi:hypothetical protein